MNRSIVWFRQDLRLHDNEALLEAIRNVDEVLPVYVFDNKPHRTGLVRAQFLIESVADLRRSLRRVGSDLIIRVGDPAEILYKLALETKSQWVYCNRERTSDEVEVQDRLEQKLWTIGRELRFTRGKMLFHTADLPFPVTQCPDHFVVFRKSVEHIVHVRLPFDNPDHFPPIPSGPEAGTIPELRLISDYSTDKVDHYFDGGESAALKALHHPGGHQELSFFTDGGSVLSPWIAMGCLSPKKVFYTSFEMDNGGEQIRNHLLYRDYLRLMAKKYGDRIFYASGIYGHKISIKRNKEVFNQWKSGNTGVPIIDAAMNQLNQTGWIPEVLRKIVAGYLVRVLKQDWRLGAAWFEYALIDYDPCSNWLSWQNIAGLGPDVRDDRIIHYDALGKRLDPDGVYVTTWNR